MPLTIAPARLEDVFLLAAVSRRSFAATSALSQAMFSKVNAEAADERFGRRLARNINGSSKKTVISAANSEGELIGFGDWDLPKTEADEVEAKEIPEPWLEGTNVELVEQFFGEMGRRQALVQAQEPHYRSSLILQRISESLTMCADLHILVADPDHFGQGVGAALLRWGMERAEQDGHRIFLDAMVAARDFYLKIGFVDYGNSPIRVGKNNEFEAYPMVWQPSTYKTPQSSSA